jgi:hypothetical protein
MQFMALLQQIQCKLSIPKLNTKIMFLFALHNVVKIL